MVYVDVMLDGKVLHTYPVSIAVAGDRAVDDREYLNQAKIDAFEDKLISKEFVSRAEFRVRR